MGRYSVIEFSALWEYVANFCKKAGRTAARLVLLLYYVMMSPKTPVKDKWMVATAIAYVVLPIDLISAKKLPIIGWIDELVSLAAKSNLYTPVNQYRQLLSEANSSMTAEGKTIGNQIALKKAIQKDNTLIADKLEDFAQKMNMNL